MNVHSYTHDNLIRAATDLSVSRGLHATSVKLIAARAQMAVGSIYNYYPSKKALFGAILNNFYKELTPLIAAENPESAYLSNFRLTFAALLNQLTENRASFELFLQLRELKTYRELSKINRKEFYEKLEDLMEQAKRNKALQNFSVNTNAVLFFEQICTHAKLIMRRPFDKELTDNLIFEDLLYYGILKSHEPD